jgi:hypothetical protein
VILREIQLEESNNKSEKERLEKILRTNDSIKKMNKLLCQNIDNEQIDISDNHLIDHLFKTTMEKLSIDQPSYSSFLAEKEK